MVENRPSGRKPTRLRDEDVLAYAFDRFATRRADEPHPLAMRVVGASESIDVILRLSFEERPYFPFEDVAALADQRLRLRAVLAEPLGGFAAPDRHRATAAFALPQWECRVIEGWPSMDCVIIDGEWAVVSRLRAGHEGTEQPSFLLRTPERVGELAAYFETLWDHGPQTALLYDDSLAFAAPETATEVIVSSKQRWDSLIQYLASNPEAMYGMQPRQFEELVAELLVRQGMEVELTPQTRDGGRDIIAQANMPIGTHLYLVECKRHARHRLIDVGIVRSLYGVVEAERATGGIVCTTSFFTGPAQDFCRDVKYRLSLKDYDHLRGWLQGIGERTSPCT